MTVTSQIAIAEAGDILNELYINAPMQFCLVDPSGEPLTAENSKSEWIAREITTEGYARTTFQWTETPSYNGTTGQWETETVNIIVAPDATPLSYEQAFIIRNGSGNRPKTFMGNAVSNNKIALTAHGLSNGDAIAFSFSPGAALPSPLVAGDLYFALNTSANNFEVSSDGLASLILGAGSGECWLKYAEGSQHLLITESPAILLTAPRTYPYKLNSRGTTNL